MCIFISSERDRKRARVLETQWPPNHLQARGIRILVSQIHSKNEIHGAQRVSYFLGGEVGGVF